MGYQHHASSPGEGLGMLTTQHNLCFPLFFLWGVESVVLRNQRSMGRGCITGEKGLMFMYNTFSCIITEIFL